MKHTILVDNREKTPLKFPKTFTLLPPTWTVESPIGKKVILLATEEVTLVTGDYALKGHEGVMLVERKGSVSEICKNCLTRDGRRKFVDCCVRLHAACRYPVLLFEGDVLSLCQPQPGTNYPPGAGLDSLLRITTDYGVRLVVLPRTTAAGRYTVGEWVARLLINTALRKDSAECLSPNTTTPSSTTPPQQPPSAPGPAASLF